MKTINTYKVLFFLLLLINALTSIGQTSFSASKPSGCAPLNTVFSANTSTAVRWLWEFGNGNSSTLENPSAQYILPGKFTVKLTAWDANGTKTSQSEINYITVFKNPNASFSSPKQTACLGELLTLNSTSIEGDASITGYSWDFGDGTIDKSKIPKHAYGTEGKYNVSLIVTDANGCFSKITSNAFFLIHPSPNVDFRQDVLFDCKAPSEVSFTNKSIGTGLRYKWVFGDGDTSSLENPKNTYTSEGQYAISLEATSDKGCTSKKVINPGITIEPLRIDFSGKPKSLCESGTVHFENIASAAGSIAYEWDFGDGNTSTKSFPSHVYTNSKRYYDVTLSIKVLNKPLCKAKLTKPAYIKVYPKPNGKIRSNIQFPCRYPFSVLYTYEDSIASSNINWFQHDYAKETTVNLNIKSDNAPVIVKDGSPKLNWISVTNKYGCSDTITAPEVKKVKLNAQFSGDTTGCAPIFATFKDISQSDFQITQRSWFIDSSYYSPLESFDYFFQGKKSHEIKLIIRDANKCVDTVSRDILIGEHMKPKFTIPGTKRTLCNNTDSLFLVNTTRFHLDSTADEFRWYQDHRNGKYISKKTGQANSYIFTNTFIKYKRPPGKVLPMLVSLNNGCIDTFISKDTIEILPPFAEMNKQGDPCYDSTLTLVNKSIQYHRWLWTYDSKVDSISKNLLLDIKKPHLIGLRVFNDTTGCWDTTGTVHTPNDVLLTINDEVSGTCTPVQVKLDANKDLSQGYWVINTNDTFYSDSPLELVFDTAGVYTVEFHYVVGKCDYKTEKEYAIFNGQMKGAVESLGGCSPTKILLFDSSFKEGSTNHVWIIDNTITVPISQTSMEYELPNSFGDSVVIILRDTSTSTGCIAEKIFNVKNTAPGFKLFYGWSNTCQQSFFQGNMLTNPDKGLAPYNYTWTFSDGQTFNKKVLSNKFTDTGWVFIAMKIQDQNGCFALDTLKFYRPPNRIHVDFIGDKNGSTCTPMFVNFFDFSTSLGQRIVKWKWEFGDGGVSYFKNPKHQYLNSGTYDIRLTVTDDIGCTETRFFPKYLVLLGPSGDFTISDLVGCTPHQVYFNEKSNNPEATMLWDYGDGVVDTGNSPTHVYTRPGIYIPSLIIREKPGCEFAVPQKDTIHIYENPIAHFTGNGICLKDEITFYEADTTLRDAIVKREWIFPSKTIKGNNSTVKHRFKDKNNTAIIHIAETENGCRDTIKKSLVLKEPEVAIFGDKDTLCLGNAWIGSADIKADTGIKKVEWFINELLHDTGIILHFLPLKANLYKVSLRVEDDAGCWDTIAFHKKINVGDTVIPPVVPIQFVSVYDDHIHEINFNQLPSHDFSSYRILEDNGSSFVNIRTVFNRADTHQYIYGLDALNKSYCYKVSVKNLCNYENSLVDLETHCTIEAKAKPLLDAARITWSPYIGWPVRQYEIQRFNETSLVYDSIGMVPGSQFVFVDSAIICHQEYTYKIKAYDADASSKRISYSDTCKAKPFYFNIVNPPVFTRATVVDGAHINLKWEEIYPNRNPIIYYNIERKLPGGFFDFNSSQTGNMPLSLNDYKTKVNGWSYTYQMRSIDACYDTSEYTSIAKSILLKTYINEDFEPILYWTHYKQWPEGVEEYVVEKRISNDTFREIGRVTAQDTLYKDKFSALNCADAFDYRVYAIRPNDTGTRVVLSYSNYSSPSVKTKIFVPNAFSPNQNKLNETFHPTGIFIKKYTMKIYNRWGEKVYDNNQCMNAWDGFYMGEPAQEGVYAYKIVAVGMNNEIFHLAGDVTLLR